MNRTRRMNSLRLRIVRKLLIACDSSDWKLPKMSGWPLGGSMPGRLPVVDTRRQMTTTVVIVCILQTVLLACVCSYVCHQLMTMSSQVRQVRHDCRCPTAHRLPRVDSPLQVNFTIFQAQQKVLPIDSASASPTITAFSQKMRNNYWLKNFLYSEFVCKRLANYSALLHKLL